MYWKPEEDADSESLFELAETDARKVVEIFDGTYFHQIDQALDEALVGARIKWIHLSDESALVGQTLGEAQIRSKTGVSVIAIQRRDRTVSNPTGDVRFQGADVLVAVGTEDQHQALSQLLE